MRKLFASFAAALALTAIAAAGTALAQQRSLPTVAVPQAVDQTLGMAILSAHYDLSNPVLGAGVVGARRVGDALHFVAFNRSVEGCTYSGSVSAVGPPLFLSPGFVTMTGGPGTLNGATYYGVMVSTTDADGEVSELPFHLLVFCPQ